MNFWLVKTDPETYSVENLKKDKSTVWDGVRNFQARNNLNLMEKGDLVLVYHSQSDKDIRCVAKVTKEAFRDTTSDDERWVAVELTYIKSLKTYVTLDMIKNDKLLSDIALVKQSRLSVMPVTKEQYEWIIELGGGLK